MELAGRVVIVTGASSGIGAAFARLAGRDGARAIKRAIETGDAEVFPTPPAEQEPQ